MGFSLKNAFVVFMALLCFIVLLLASGCFAGHGNSYGHRTARGVEIRRILRKAPSGPDPIHHSAAHPNNPTTTSPPKRY